MGLADLLKSFARASALGLALYSCGGEEKQGCSTDYDCREPRVCVRGYCEGERENGSGNGGDFLVEKIFVGHTFGPAPRIWIMITVRNILKMIVYAIV